MLRRCARALFVSALAVRFALSPVPASGSEVGRIRPRRRLGWCLTGQLRRGRRDPKGLVVEPLERIVFAPFRKAGFDIDVFSVTNTENCEEVKSVLAPFAPRAVACRSDLDYTPAGHAWFEAGPATPQTYRFTRATFMLQLRDVQVCDDLFDESGETYDIVARQRFDVLWRMFPQDLSGLDEQGVVWDVHWVSDWGNHYLNDRFAIGNRAAMRRYLRAFDELVDPSRWERHRRLQELYRGIVVERMFTTTMLAGGVQMRQHRGICFNRFRDENARGDAIEEKDECAGWSIPRHPHGFVENSDLFSPATDPGPYGGSSWLIARLLHFWWIEWGRVGRPARVLDFGCGRGRHLRWWFRSYSGSLFGVDAADGMANSLGQDVLQIDLAEPVNWSDHVCRAQCEAECSWPPDLHKLDDGSFLQALAGCCPSLEEVAPGPSSPSNLADASGFAAPLPPSDGPLHGRPPLMACLPWKGGKADWVIALGIAAEIPEQLHGVLLENIAAAASEGAIVAWGRGSGIRVGRDASAPERRILLDFWRPLLQRGFRRDLSLERWLRVFSRAEGAPAQQPVVLRRIGRGAMQMTVPCELRLVRILPGANCNDGWKYGCVDSQNIWVADGCAGIFSRGRPSGTAHPRATVCSSRLGGGRRRAEGSVYAADWYVECALPEGAELSDAEHHVQDASAAFPRPGTFLSSVPESCGGNAPLWSAKDSHWVGDGVVFDFLLPALLVWYIRSPFDADVTAEAMWSPRKVERVTFRWRVRAGVCQAWNLWPLFPGHVRFVLKAPGRGPLTADSMDVGSVLRLPFTRKIDYLDGIASLYDLIDPAAVWLPNSGGWHRVAPAVDGFTDDGMLEDFALYVRIVWLLGLSDAELARMPRSEVMRMAARLRRCRPWSQRAAALLAEAARRRKAFREVNVSAALGSPRQCPWGDVEKVPQLATVGQGGRLVFEDSLAGHHLFHEAFAAPME